MHGSIAAHTYPLLRSSIVPKLRKRGEAPDPRKPRRGRPPRQPEEGEAPNLHVIKRYNNRRLYDAKLRRAVTADEVAELVRRGEPLRVHDDADVDITRRFLVQLLVDHGDAASIELVPVELLRMLVGARSAPYAEWLGRYLRAGAEYVRRQSEAVLSAGEKLTAEHFDTWTADAETSDVENEVRTELADLQRRMADLSARVTRR